MTTKKYYLLALLLSVIPCYGGAQQWNVFLSGTSSTTPSSYTIPSGKVYILEAVHLIKASGTPSPSTTQIRVSRKANNGSFAAYFTITIKDTFEGGTVWLPNKLRLKGGERLYIPTNASYGACRYFGILMDEADLYAANLPVELINPRLSGGKLMADAKVASPRPHKIIIQSATTDLSAFIYDPTGETTPTADPRTSVVSVDQGAVGKKFIRVMAKTRK